MTGVTTHWISSRRWQYHVLCVVYSLDWLHITFPFPSRINLPYYTMSPPATPHSLSPAPPSLAPPTISGWGNVEEADNSNGRRKGEEKEDHLPPPWRV